MAEPKKPQDHQKKAEKPSVTKSDDGWIVVHKGVSVEVSSEAFDDFELMDLLDAVEGGNALKLPSLLRRLVGDGSYAAVLEGLRDKKTGRVPLADGAEFVGEILQAINPNS